MDSFLSSISCKDWFNTKTPQDSWDLIVFCREFWMRALFRWEEEKWREVYINIVLRRKTYNRTSFLFIAFGKMERKRIKIKITA